MARLPVPGSDDGQWGGVLNDFLSVEHNGDGTLKSGGSLAAKANDTAVVHLAGVETVTGAKNFTGNLQHNGNAVVDTTDLRLTNQSGYYPAQAYGFFAMTAPPTSGSKGSFGDGCLFLSRVYVPAGNAIARVAIYVTDAATLSGGGANGFAVYDDTGAQLATTPSDNTLWTATGWRSGIFATPIAAQNSARCVYVGVIKNGYTGNAFTLYDNFEGNQYILGAVGTGPFRHNIFQPGVSSFPASFDPTSYGGANTFKPIMGFASS